MQGIGTAYFWVTTSGQAWLGTRSGELLAFVGEDKTLAQNLALMTPTATLVLANGIRLFELKTNKRLNQKLLAKLDEQSAFWESANTTFENGTSSEPLVQGLRSEIKYSYPWAQAVGPLTAGALGWSIGYFLVGKRERKQQEAKVAQAAALESLSVANFLDSEATPETAPERLAFVRSVLGLQDEFTTESTRLKSRLKQLRADQQYLETELKRSEMIELEMNGSRTFSERVAQGNDLQVQLDEIHTTTIEIERQLTLLNDKQAVLQLRTRKYLNVPADLDWYDVMQRLHSEEQLLAEAVGQGVIPDHFGLLADLRDWRDKYNPQLAPFDDGTHVGLGFSVEF
jgi:hypothetical protein